MKFQDTDIEPERARALMIGNACPVGTVRALVRAAMAGAVQEAA